MYRFQLSRKEVTACDDETTVLGYNYYLVAYINQNLVKDELLYSSLALPNALCVVEHDAHARVAYNHFVDMSNTPS